MVIPTLPQMDEFSLWTGNGKKSIKLCSARDLNLSAGRSVKI
jgi:hypothetical protein